jgi:predicted house-cleaning noncanonical NTP pyrophosphatase (MazG superfamily)
MVIVHNKLVRDRIPEIIAADGKSYRTRVLSNDEYHEQLRTKLDEEVREFDASREAEELADVLEIVYALAACQGVDPTTLEAIRASKRIRNGGFERRLLLIDVES